MDRQYNDQKFEDTKVSVHRFTSTDYHFVIFKLLVIVLSVHRFTATDYHFVIFKLLVIVLSVHRFTSMDRQYNDQKFEDTKVVISRCKSMDRQYNDQKFEDNKVVISIHRFTSTDYPFGIFTPLLQLMCKFYRFRRSISRLQYQTEL
jgi:hypothetical protein